MEEKRKESQSQSKDNDNDSITPPPTTATTTMCSDSLRASAFNTWTILTPDDPATDRTTTTITTNQDEETETETDQQHSANNRCRTVDDIQADELSDGISIISDCESTERISPHPFLELKYDTGDELSELRHRHHQHQHDNSTTSPPPPPQLLAPLSAAAPPPQPPASSSSSSTSRTIDELPPVVKRIEFYLPPLVQNGLTGLFYVCATLAILAFIGKLRYPEWQVVGGGGGGGDGQSLPLGSLVQRLEQLELQNNLMRAEIDIISKQLNYLSSKATQQPQGNYQQQHQHYEGGGGNKKGKTFRAWAGNGNVVEPVDITKQDLKRPHKCADGKFVEIATMCGGGGGGGGGANVESLADEIGNMINDVLQESQTFRQFEKATETLGNLNIDDNNDDNNNNGQRDKQQMNSKERYNKERPHQHHHHQQQPQHQQQHQQQQQQQHFKPKKDGSWEHRKYDKRQQQQQHKHRDHDDDDDDDDRSSSGEWHGKRMMHRENARRQNEQRQRDKNWFIERGDSREQFRTTETRTRH